MTSTDNQFDTIATFALSQDVEIPESALKMAAVLLLDTIGVAAGGAELPAGRIARDYAVEFQGAARLDYQARILFDGRRASIPGAAFAAATQIDNLDGHDGYNPTKGHIGCAVIPALLAFAEAAPDLSGRDALKTLVIAYEVAARSGISLHASVTDYHTSGAWNGIGVAALGCRLRGTGSDVLRQAIGIAEYHGPRSQMMREIANPTMLHDGSGMGALTGSMAVLLAERGFEGAPAITIEAPEAASHWQDLGTYWTIEQNYIKPYPVCRWAHAAIDAVYELRARHQISHEDVETLEINTFSEAACLVQGVPTTTSEAQYSLSFAVAIMVIYGEIGPEHIQQQALSDPDVGQFLKRIIVHESDVHCRRFPEGRWSDVIVTLKSGETFRSGDVHAKGGPERPMKEAEVKEKFNRMTKTSLPQNVADNVWDTGRQLIAADSQFSQFSDLLFKRPKHGGGI